MKNAKMYQPYTGPFPRKPHSHCCINCLNSRGQGAVDCYKKHCTKPIRTETCVCCQPLTPSAYRCITDEELAQEYARLSPQDKARVDALPPTGTTDDDDNSGGAQ